MMIYNFHKKYFNLLYITVTEGINELVPSNPARTLPNNIPQQSTPLHTIVKIVTRRLKLSRNYC